ncbi:M20/M25/M40 family metallo-hydrolase [Novosphingobium sp. G106]|uniref:M20/M25/M40 family metallo-hydrolase n=1 Tax=Novosphingobium sp. G106 TaxID=2849500 RepID=UPI0028122A2E|nr:M20/M25/M40 family metallo-hydrolase [Novosphingobium sp. G106]
MLFLAHWDGFGRCAEPPAEDLICNGAIDNASGVAVLTEIARRLSRERQMDRDIYFLATTAEELGLLGAHAFAENPPLPLGQIVAAFNIDSVAIAPAGTPLGIVGKGLTPLDTQIAAVARQQKRKIVDGDAANAYLRRQDGWALQQHDIPAVMVTSAYGDLSKLEHFFEGNYHRPHDDLNQKIELGGAAEDVAFHVALGRWFADSRRVPKRTNPGR